MAGKSTCTEERQRQIKILALKGFTDKEMASVVGVTEQTFNNWKKQKPLFFESLKDWKLIADHEVERSLYERAKGYEHTETKAQFVDGDWETIDMTKHYAPDPTSMIFWLKNRKSAEWRDKAEIEVSAGKDIIEALQAGRNRMNGK